MATIKYSEPAGYFPESIRKQFDEPKKSGSKAKSTKTTKTTKKKK